MTDQLNRQAVLRNRLRRTGLLSILLLVFTAATGLGQSRSAIGFLYGINKPFADVYKFGKGGALQATIAFNRKWGLEPSLGIDRINENDHLYGHRAGDPGYNASGNLNLFHFDLALRFYILPCFFAKLGPNIYVGGGNEDIIAGGIGGTAGLGYQLMLDQRNKLEFVFNTQFIDADYSNGFTPIANLKIAYAFNFRR